MLGLTAILSTSIDSIFTIFLTLLKLIQSEHVLSDVKNGFYATVLTMIVFIRLLKYNTVYKVSWKEKVNPG